MNLSNQIVKTLFEYVLNSVLLFLHRCKSFHLYSTLPLTERAFSLHLFRVDSQIAEQFGVDLLDRLIVDAYLLRDASMVELKADVTRLFLDTVLLLKNHCFSTMGDQGFANYTRIFVEVALDSLHLEYDAPIRLKCHCLAPSQLNQDVVVGYKEYLFDLCLLLVCNDVDSP